MSVLLACGLDWELRRGLILHKTGLLAKGFYFLHYQRQVFFRICTFYLFLNWFSTHVSNNQKYVCSHRLYTCINAQKFKGLDSREITSLPEIKKVIYMHVISIIAENILHAHHKDLFAYNESLQHLTILFFFFSHSVVFTCSKVINASSR